MQMRILFMAFIFAASSAGDAGDWPQFRGPGGNGLSEGEDPPIEFGPGKKQLWKIAAPAGHSSPIVAGDFLVLTGEEDGRLKTLCFERSSGKLRWSEMAPQVDLEKVHAVNSHASPTPATDGKRIFVYFGSYGLIAYNLEGKVLWQKPIPKPKSTWGTASSPIVVQDKVILLSDSNDGTSALFAFDPETGEEKWKAPRSKIASGWSTPYLWQHHGTNELIVGGSSTLFSYDPGTGAERWRMGGLFRDAIAMPASSEDLLFYVSPGVGGGDARLPSWKEFAAEFDANHDGKVEKKELPKGAGFVLRPAVPRETPGNIFQYAWIFGGVDANQDGSLDESEFGLAVEMLKNMPSSVFAVRPGAHGDVPGSDAAWRQTKGLPEIPSPLYYRGHLYLLKDGGMLTCYEGGTGKAVYDRERLGATGQYCASPIAASGRIYAAAQNGVITVLKAGEKPEILAKNNLGEQIYATPALADNKIYVRSKSSLWAFGE